MKKEEKRKLRRSEQQNKDCALAHQPPPPQSLPAVEPLFQGLIPQQQSKGTDETLEQGSTGFMQAQVRLIEERIDVPPEQEEEEKAEAKTSVLHGLFGL